MKKKIFNYTNISLLSLLHINPVFAEVNTGDKLKLEEVLITARHRTESLIETPVSAVVLNNESLNAIVSSGDDIRALANHVPGLYIESSNGRIAPRFYIRGLGNVDFDLAASQPVSVVFDDIVQENVVLKSFPIFDVDNIEIIRGPQGSLYGRNTTAGIVKINTRKPSQETEGYIKVNYGTYDTANLETAIGGSLINDTLLGRLSILSQNRNDWIDNDFTGENNALGGYQEIAARGQLLYIPTEDFSALLNYHTRNLDGSQTAFMANIFTTGSNNLNDNYDRDSVFYNGGDNNTQKYRSSGSSLNLTLNYNDIEIKSISGYEEAKGSNTGDIDGGVAGEGPGFIPFDSATIDDGDIDQFTQEFIIQNTNSSFWNWQLGAYYFNSSLSVTTDAEFNIATVNHDNRSSAIFTHNTFQLSEKMSLGLGLRYTNDKKTLESEVIETISVKDEQVNGDVSLNYSLTNKTSIYSRIADGFRAPSIQGRDIAFLGEPSIADSENIISYEAGVKSNFFDEKIRLNAAIFYYEIKGFQLSAIGGATNSNSLLNAKKGVGQGFEVDLEAIPTENIKVTIGLSYNDTEIKDSDLFTVICGSGQCTPTDPINENGNANIDGNPFPGAPESSFNFTFRYQIPTKNSGTWYLFSDLAYQGKVNLALYESKEFMLDPQLESGLRLGFENKDYDISIFARNITDEDNVKGFVDFNNNTGFVNEPRIIGVELNYTF